MLSYLENIGLKRRNGPKTLGYAERFPDRTSFKQGYFYAIGRRKQILSIAASYISGTDVVVLDEPSSNLDEENIQIVSEMLEKLKKQKYNNFGV